MDGAVVSGNCVTACDKNTTYDYLNHPIVEELYEKHKNGELDFGGVILCPVTPKLSEKEKFTSYSAKLAKMLGLDGVIISQEGGGNPETDTMLLCKKCEEMGVKTVVMTHENSGELGDSDPLTYFVPEADAIVTMGNTNIKITLPPMDKIIGDIKTVEKLSGSLKNALKEDGSIGVMLDAIVGSINNFGVSKMTTRLY
jgi:glycine reductase